MAIKKIIIYMFLPLGFILLGCPSEDCTFATKDTRVENLAKIEPIHQIYHLGDTITYAVTIPSHIENFGNIGEVNLYQETGVLETLYGGSGISKLKGNTIDVLEGRMGTIQETTVAYVSYYPETNDYRFKARVIFTRTGNYSLKALNDTRVRFDSGNEFCTEYVIQTSTQGVNTNGEFNFTVEE